MAAIYRMYDADGQLLYVGTSIDPLRRFGEHDRNTGWFADIATITVERVPRNEMYVAEQSAIANERPLININHRQGSVRKANMCRSAVDAALSVRLGTTVSAYLHQKRSADPPVPWRQLAEDLETETNGAVVVCYESLRVWHMADQAAAA